MLREPRDVAQSGYARSRLRSLVTLRGNSDRQWSSAGGSKRAVSVTVSRNRSTPAPTSQPCVRSYPVRSLMITRSFGKAGLLTTGNAAGRRPSECSRIRSSYTDPATVQNVGGG